MLSLTGITILIAHRLSTIMLADVIYVLQKGKVSETGSHDQLPEQKGLYYAMWAAAGGKKERKLVLNSRRPSFYKQ